MAGERRESVPPGSGERRSATRVPVDVWVEESRERETYFQRGANLSVGGIFLDRSIAHPLGTVMALKFTLPGESAPIQVRGTIVNVALGGRGRRRQRRARHGRRVHRHGRPHPGAHRPLRGRSRRQG